MPPVYLIDKQKGKHMKFIALRHGETDMNATKIIQGKLDFNLNEAGVTQMKRCVATLPTGIDVVFSSPLARARQSAIIIASRLGVPILLSNALRERDFGILEGRSWDEVLNFAGKDIKERDRLQAYDYRPWGGDCAKERREELDNFLVSLSAIPFNFPLLITHGGIIRMLYSMFNPNRIPSEIPNASFYEFEI